MEVINLKIDSQKIDLLQAQQGLTSTALAKKSGISRQNISTIKGRGTCNPLTLAKLAVGLGVDPSELIAKEGE